MRKSAYECVRVHKDAYECVAYTNIVELISRVILIPRSCLYAPWFWRYSNLCLQMDLHPLVFMVIETCDSHRGVIGSSTWCLGSF